MEVSDVISVAVVSDGTSVAAVSDCGSVATNSVASVLEATLLLSFEPRELNTKIQNKQSTPIRTAVIGLSFSFEARYYCE